MWKAYLKVIAQLFPGAVHMIDRFHVTQLLNQTVDKVRRSDMAAMKGRPQAERIKGLRWTILRRFSRVRGRARLALTRMMSSRLARVVTRRSYGYRSFHVLEVMLYHTLGKLPMPDFTHRF